MRHPAPGPGCHGGSSRPAGCTISGPPSQMQAPGDRGRGWSGSANLARLEMEDPHAWVASPPPETFLGDGFELRRRRLSDAPMLLAAIDASRAHLEPWLPARVLPCTLDETDACLRDWEHAWDIRSAFHYNLVVDGVIAGAFTLFNRVGPYATELGYWVGSGFTRRGFARAASIILARAAFEPIGARRVLIVVDEANAASTAVARAIGCERWLAAGAPPPPYVRWVLSAPPPTPANQHRLVH